MYKRQVATMSAIAFVLIFSMSVASAAVRTVTIRVKGMTCNSCATSVEKALKSTEGVASANVSYKRGKAVIKYDNQKTTVAKLREVINSTGFTCDLK